MDVIDSLNSLTYCFRGNIQDTANAAVSLIRAQADRIAHLEKAEARLLAERHQEAALRQTAEGRAAWCAAECRRLEAVAYEPAGDGPRRTWRQRYDEAVAAGAKQREEIDGLKQQLMSRCRELAEAKEEVDELRRRVDAAGTRGVELTSTIASLRQRLEAADAEVSRLREAGICGPTLDDPLGRKTWFEKWSDARALVSKLREEIEGERKRAGELQTQLDFSRAEVEHWHSLYWATLKQAAEIESMKAPAPIVVKVIDGDAIERAKEQVGQAAGCQAANTLSGAHHEMANDLNARLSKVESGLGDLVARVGAVEAKAAAAKIDTSRLSERLAAHAETLDQHIQNHHNADSRGLFERVFGQKG